MLSSARLPDEADGDLLAVFRLGEAVTPDEEERTLFEAIPERRTTRHAFEQCRLPPPLPAILSTPHDSAADWLHAGRALSRVLLRLAADGATAACLNQPLETPQLRPLLQDVMGTDHTPQLLLRFGYGPETKASVRRPLSELLI